MTREETKQNLHYGLQFGTLKPQVFIDSIFDYFENKKCPNCRYANLDSARYLAIHKCSMGVSAIDYDFGCTYWKSKDTK